MKLNADMTIIGGGVGGLLLAWLMGKKGYKIVLVERESEEHNPLRGELLQPGAVRSLDEMGLLNRLIERFRVSRILSFRFEGTNGEVLMEVAYRRLPAPYNEAISLVPSSLRRLLRESVLSVPNIQFVTGADFVGIRWERGKVVGGAAHLTAAGEAVEIGSPLIVGADGVHSRVRERSGIPTQMTMYRDGYLTTLIECPKGFGEEGRYYLGRRELLGVFPTAQDRLYVFYMVPNGDREPIFSEGLESFHCRLCRVAPYLDGPLSKIVSWDGWAYRPCAKIHASSWVMDGLVLIGDAAHTMNPHVAQGTNQAIEDVRVLVDVLERDCFSRRDFSRGRLSRYERARRPTVEPLQRLGDELTWTWNSGWFAPIRNRTLRNLSRQAALQEKVLNTVAGLKIQPLTLSDRFHMLVAPRPCIDFL
jgi:2-polyprenyl-6-methoxyphenol hydroxylase-like FAD-dependent oxidoreductase